MYRDRLEELRENNNLKMREVSKILNLSIDAYGQYEREYYVFPIKHLNTVCNYFDVSLDYIFSFTDDKQYFNSKKDIDKILSGKRIRELRRELKYSQSMFADIMNSSYGTIAGYEKGRYIIATPFLYTICKKYGISADYLLGKIDEPKSYK